MSNLGRREFLLSGAAVLPLMAACRAAYAAKNDADSAPAPFRIGAQSYSFRHFKSPEEAIAQLKLLGLSEIEFCSVHFPPDTAAEGFPAIKELIASSGVTVPVYGVEEFTADKAANRKKFEFGKALGLEVISANPKPDSFGHLDELCAEFNIKIGIHNHGPGADYDKVADTLTAIKGRSPLIGACVDTGHVIRSGEKPHEVIAELGDRVHSLHLKDWKHGGEEQVLGEGDLDLVAVARELKAIRFSGPIMMEYENHPDNPVPHMKKGLENFLAAAASA